MGILYKTESFISENNPALDNERKTGYHQTLTIKQDNFWKWKSEKDILTGLKHQED